MLGAGSPDGASGSSTGAPRWGLMGVVADAVLAAGGRATGVITESLAGHEIAHFVAGGTCTWCRTMHERKALMAELADGFVMLPGGFGTCEEFMESVTWAQPGHPRQARVGSSTSAATSTTSCAFLGHAVEQGFIESRQVDGLAISDDADQLLDAIVGSPCDQVAAR